MHGGSVYDASYLQFYQLLIDVRASGRKYTELTTTELQTVENITQANAYGSVYAQSLLAMLNQTIVDRIPHKESTQSNKSAAINELQSMVQIYPNPTNNTVTIESAVKVAKLSVYNITGQFMEQRDLVEGKNDLKMDFPNGTYFFQIQSEQQMITHKVVIAQ
ncbi:MAG: T9SS type A sorting domain-containing protein [Chitinophagales bacterium]